MVFHLQTSYAEQRDDHLCPASSCGNIPNVSYPFRLPTDPPNCWKKRYELSCENNNCSTVLNLYSGKYHVRAIDYDNYTIRLADVNIDKANCFTVPLYSLAAYNFIDESPYSGSFFLNDNGKTLDNISLSEVIIFIKCENPVESPLYVPTDPCINSSSAASTTLSKEEYYSYVKVGGTNTLELEDSCRIELMVMITSRLQRISENSSTNISDRDIHNQLVYGFELSWLPSFAKNDKGDCHVEGSNNMVHCYSDDWRTNTPTILKIAFLVFFVVLGVFLSIGIQYLWRFRFLIKF
ncbi:LEAF RUST 10 DISEASE-RESISTANCE LOCUS RECEPTOR-LIKE PROTEIN KINASE-like 2.1 isoform X2 [Ziziphus jujuba]|uniref:LEAF RUST 10 DISEASE-RESISTANCE LOCUS RECEPTOR-LIKE PROTEIN KINASE-like 2.1 isoform X2 n=1 Tax=Ziziphus jujuba TaxID=326968 RepID=A0ABM4A204_ZIZJJ|nr:LEAF RUST 10 DISEASE-RESISTANCE LOCUS RECEPTOR-LIKE PROTEIN KINASE-like 2.1 isoform X2 [Ziziphus jujuba]XP_060670761.1 LEAF RUST 10 DISEASE-RESISTANCE LOCUS RECEPTOR-LIKE PROTEIN KINASE-like 2.1 isoform X2 [Ziziphus jujuba]